MLFFILALLVYQDLPVFSKVGLKSEILKQERELWLYREASDYEKCPVLYLLDGKENFLTVVGIYQSLRRTNEIPPLMIVAVANIDREYDLSPSHIDVDYMKSGGGPNFHKFFKNELIPFIESKYPVTGHRTIVGHSLGAIFNLMLLTKDSGLFQNYLSISPSLWWDNQLISAELMQEVTKWDESKAALKLFMSMANEGSLADPNGKIMLDEYTKLKDFLTKSKRIAFNYRDNFTENHLSTVVSSTYYGLRFLFSEWNLDPFLEAYNFTDLKAALESNSDRYGFQIKPPYEIVNMGRYYHNKNEMDQAIAILEYGLRFYPEGIQMNGFLGDAYLKNKDYKKAKQVFESALKIAIRKKSPMIEWFENKLKQTQQ